MKLLKMILLAVAALAAAASTAPLADDRGSAGTDDPAAQVELATSRQVEILAGLISGFPDQVEADIERALQASRKGRDAALAALSARPDRLEAGAAGGGRPSVTGLERARDRIAASFEKTTSTLQRVMARVPEQAAAKIQEALAKIQEQRTAALQNIERVIQRERPERSAVERPERPARPERAQPDRPEKPEHPRPPERPPL